MLQLRNLYGICSAWKTYTTNCSASAKKIWHAFFSNFSTLCLYGENSRQRLNHLLHQLAPHTASDARTPALHSCNETQPTVHYATDAHMMGHAWRAIAYHAHDVMQ